MFGTADVGGVKARQMFNAVKTDAGTKIRQMFDTIGTDVGAVGFEQMFNTEETVMLLLGLNVWCSVDRYWCCWI